jgi:hypothetical protein
LIILEQLNTKFAQNWEILKQSLQYGRVNCTLLGFIIKNPISNPKCISSPHPQYKNCFKNLSIVKSEDTFHPECKLDLILKYILYCISESITILYLNNFSHRNEPTSHRIDGSFMVVYKMNSYTCRIIELFIKNGMNMYECNGKFIWMCSS